MSINSQKRAVNAHVATIIIEMSRDSHRSHLIALHYQHVSALIETRGSGDNKLAVFDMTDLEVMTKMQPEMGLVEFMVAHLSLVSGSASPVSVSLRILSDYWWNDHSLVSRIMNTSRTTLWPEENDESSSIPPLA